MEFELEPKRKIVPLFIYSATLQNLVNIGDQEVWFLQFMSFKQNGKFKFNFKATRPTNQRHTRSLKDDPDPHVSHMLMTCCRRYLFGRTVSPHTTPPAHHL
jgi:hypothetical protein